MWRGFIAPQMYFLLGEIPLKNGEITTPQPNRQLIDGILKLAVFGEILGGIWGDSPVF
jgi:hypothetical protein